MERKRGGSLEKNPEKHQHFKDWHRRTKKKKKKRAPEKSRKAR